MVFENYSQVLSNYVKICSFTECIEKFLKFVRGVFHTYSQIMTFERVDVVITKFTLEIFYQNLSRNSWKTIYTEWIKDIL